MKQNFTLLTLLFFALYFSSCENNGNKAAARIACPEVLNQMENYNPVLRIDSSSGQFYLRGFVEMPNNKWLNVSTPILDSPVKSVTIRQGVNLLMKLIEFDYNDTTIVHTTPVYVNFQIPPSVYNSADFFYVDVLDKQDSTRPKGRTIVHKYVKAEDKK